MNTLYVSTEKYAELFSEPSILLLLLLYTGCSLNIVFFSKILKYIPDSGLSQCQCVYTMAGQTPPAALQQKCQSSEKSQHFKAKHNI